MNKKKLITFAICGALTITIGGYASYTTYADNLTKQQQLSQIKAQEVVERDKLESIPNQTKEEIDATVEQGRKVKDLGIEAGKLEEELTSNPQKDLENQIYNFEIAFADTYAEMKKQAASDARYVKALNNLEKKKEIVDQVKNDLKNNMKSVAELIVEMEKLNNMPVFE